MRTPGRIRTPGRPFFCGVVPDHDLLRSDGNVRHEGLQQAPPEGRIVLVSGPERLQPSADDLLGDHRPLQLCPLNLHGQLVRPRLKLPQTRHERRAGPVFQGADNVRLLPPNLLQLFPERRGGVQLLLRVLDLHDLPGELFDHFICQNFPTGRIHDQVLQLLLPDRPYVF